MVNGAGIKAIVRHIVDRVGGNLKAAELCGALKSDVSFWCNDHHDRHAPVDHLMILDEAADDLFLKEWALTRGYDLKPRQAHADIPAHVTKIMGHFAKEAGELSATVLEAAEDNHFTPTEKRLIRDSIAPVKDLISALERAIGG